MDVRNCNWDDVHVDDPDLADDAFVFAFLELDKKYCPIKMCQVKDQYEGKPWITKGLQKARNQKNQLDKKFDGRDLVIVRKNIRLQEQTNCQYEDSKKRTITVKCWRTEKITQKTWKIMNSIIHNKSSHCELPGFFLNKVHNKVDGF